MVPLQIREMEVFENGVASQVSFFISLVCGLSWSLSSHSNMLQRSLSTTDEEERGVAGHSIHLNHLLSLRYELLKGKRSCCTAFVLFSIV